MPTAYAVCATCGHIRDWHDRAKARVKLRADPPFERPCYREVRGTPCPCDGFRDSGEAVVLRVGPPTRRGLFTNALLTLVLVLMGLALLYAYRSQAPAIPQLSLTQAVRDVEAGRVRAVTIEGTQATLELRDAGRERTAIPSVRDDPLTSAVLAYNSANPTTPIELRYQTQSETFTVIASILLSLLPVLLIGAFMYYVLTLQRRR